MYLLSIRTPKTEHLRVYRSREKAIADGIVFVGTEGKDMPDGSYYAYLNTPKYGTRAASVVEVEEAGD